MRHALFAIAAATLVLAVGCRNTSPDPARPPRGATSPAPDVTSATPEADAQEAPPPVPDEGSGSLAGAPPPSVALSDQTCASHADCRVFQPGDWNARVECCYEYRCDLDYVAINEGTWQALRAWQRENPFDCVAHLQEEGPCNARTPRCGLVQDAPAAACVDGLCQATLPETWPVADPEAQRCTSASECVAYRPVTTSATYRCCDGAACDDTWVAINTSTAEELQRWRQHHAQPCAMWREDNTCPAPTPCNAAAPEVFCRGGECVLQ